MVFICSCKPAIRKIIEIQPICVETQNSNSETLELIKKCYYKNYLFKSVGTPDYKGRYSYDYEIFEIKEKDTLKTLNSKFFKSESQKIEILLNKKLKEDYESDLNEHLMKECMRQINFRYYDLDEFGVTFFNNNIMEFNITHDEVSGACFNVSGNSVFLEMETFKIIDL